MLARNSGNEAKKAMKYIETFSAPWPGVLVEIKDHIDVSFLTIGTWRDATVRILVSKTLVPRSRLQPHVRELRASLARRPNCRIVIEGTEETAHRVEIEYRR